MSRTPVDTLIEGGFVLTMDPQNRLIENGAVAVKGKSIVAVDTLDKVQQAYTAHTVIDASNKVVMPGLVDTYGHAGHGLSLIHI